MSFSNSGQVRLGKYDAMRTIRECVYSADLDMRTPVFTARLSHFPITRHA
jgi:hypothetical protein